MISGNHCSCVWYIDENNVASKLIATTYFIGIFRKYLINSRKKNATNLQHGRTTWPIAIEWMNQQIETKPFSWQDWCQNAHIATAHIKKKKISCQPNTTAGDYVWWNRIDILWSAECIKKLTADIACRVSLFVCRSCFCHRFVAIEHEIVFHGFFSTLQRVWMNRALWIGLKECSLKYIYIFERYSIAYCIIAIT